MENKKINEDDSLIKDFLAGDEKAFNQLVLKYRNRIYTLCFHMIGSHEEADDAAQETFIKVYSNLHKFRFKSRFTTWLFRIAVNTCKNRFASSYFKFKKKSVEFEKSSFLHKDDSISLLAEIVKKEEEVIILNAINKLPAKIKAVILLRDINGLSYEEISGITGHNMGTVKSKISRGRLKLKEMLKDVLTGETGLSKG